MSAVVTESDRRAFARDGAVVLRGAISPDWLKLLAQGIEANKADLSELAHRYSGDDQAGDYWGDYCNWERFEQYRRFLFESPAAGHAGQVLGAQTIRLFHEHVLVKEPATAEITPWHHDLPYYCLAGDMLASTWIPLDPVPESVCPRFGAGTHRGVVYAPRKFADGAAYYPESDGEYPALQEQSDLGDTEILSWELEPGDCIVFHMRTLHNAPATTGQTTRRRAFSARWLGDDAVFDTRPGATSPPYPQLHATLAPGDPLPSTQFPLLWSLDTAR